MEGDEDPRAPPVAAMSNPNRTMSLFSKSTLEPGQLNDYGLAKLPPGQLLTQKFPVMTYGAAPVVERAEWNLEIAGAVKEKRIWTWDDIMSMRQTTLRADFHCVTHWSRFDDEFTGVRFSDFYQALDGMVDPSATHVMQHATGGYTTNLPLQVMLEEDVMFVHTFNGAPLERDHGGPMRIFTPRRYAWKGAKWIRALEFLTSDRPGFWEQNGYSNTADPWANDRYW